MTALNDQHNSFDELPDHSGGFVAGFSIGLIAGAAAYYLFGTEKGRVLRSTLVEEWESAKEHMADEGILKDRQLSLRQFMQKLIQDVFNTSLPDEIMRPPQQKKTSKTSGRRPSKRTRKFSGV